MNRAGGGLLHTKPTYGLQQTGPGVTAFLPRLCAPSPLTRAQGARHPARC
jgi:hypothetical protein